MGGGGRVLATGQLAQALNTKYMLEGSTSEHVEAHNSGASSVDTSVSSYNDNTRPADSIAPSSPG